MESGGFRSRRYASYQEGSLDGTSESGRVRSSGGARGRGIGNRGRNYDSVKHYGSREQKSANRGNRGKLSTDGKTKLTGVPQEYMGLVIGKYGAMLDEISRETGAVLERINRDVYISGSPEAQRRAHEKINEIIESSCTRCYLPTGNITKLSSVPDECLGAVIGTQGWMLRSIEAETETRLRLDGKDIYISGASENQHRARVRIKQIITNEDLEATFVGLKEELLDTLRNLHREKDENGLQVDMWCHFGRVYLKGIDEVMEGDDFTVEDIRSHLGPSSLEKPMWGTIFKNGITKMELRELEAALHGKARSSTEDDRQDFSILTPTYRQVRAKAWLVKENVDLAAAVGSKYSFSQSPPVLVRNQLQRVLSEENGDAASSSQPSFFLCAPFQRRMAVDIILPGHRFDCRLIIRSSERDASENQEPYEKEEDQIIKDYLSQMRIAENGTVILPPEIENFEISYNRRSLRRTYSDDSAGIPCSLTVCKEEDATDKDGDLDKYVDIHLHCDEWDQSLQEGNWEPEQIVQRLPQFLQFVTSVQRNLKLLDQSDARDKNSC